MKRRRSLSASPRLSCRPIRRRNASSVNPQRVEGSQQLAVFEHRLGQRVLPGAGLELGDQQRGGDVALFERRADPEQVVPLRVDQGDLGVVLEQRARQGPSLVVAGRPGPVELFLGELRDPRREALVDEVEHRERRKGLTVAVGGVLEQRQFGRVAENLVERERRVTLGRDDDLRAERRVLIGDVGVARQALVNEVSGERPPGQRLATGRQAQAVGGRRRAVAEELATGGGSGR